MHINMHFVTLRPFSIAVVLPARAERTCFNFCYWFEYVSNFERFLFAFVHADTLGAELHLTFWREKLPLS